MHAPAAVGEGAMGNLIKQTNQRMLPEEITKGLQSE